MSDNIKAHYEQDLRLQRDENGVFHIHAACEVDLYYGLGLAQGTDRALQMLLVRILSYGRGSELLTASEEMLEIDRFFRRLNFRSDSDHEIDRISTQDRLLADAYCSGVNAALRKKIPWEFKLFGYKPPPWQIRDSVVMSRLAGYISLADSQEAAEKFLLELVQAGLAEDKLRALFPLGLEGFDPDLIRSANTSQAPIIPDAIRESAIPNIRASNNWAISGQHSQSGHALLASDPHLECNRLPSVWYEVAGHWTDNGKQRFVCSATMPGLPGFLIGRTEKLGWGATYAFMDATDSWVEECRDGHFKRIDEGEEKWLPFKQRKEIIKRKGKADVEMLVYENRHGILDGDPTNEGRYVATRWTCARGSGGQSLTASFANLRAATVSESMAALGQIETAFNWVIADNQGNIGFQMSGKMPKRHPEWGGLAPAPGWRPEYDWQGMVPSEQLPSCLNPDAGMIITANDNLNHWGEASPINLPMGDYRARRIQQLLAQKDNWRAEDMIAVQMDDYSLQAEQYLEILRPLLPDNEAGQALKSWDCRYQPESTAAILFERWYLAMLLEVFGQGLSKELLNHSFQQTNILTDFYAQFDQIVFDENQAWFEGRDRNELFKKVAEETLTNASEESWGERQSVPMQHLLFGGKLPKWFGFDYGPIQIRGNRATPHQGQIYQGGGRTTTFVASYRLCADMSENYAWTNLAGGPSDRRFSPWYTAGIEDWIAGKLKKVNGSTG